MNVRSTPVAWGLAGLAIAALVALPLVMGEDETGPDGFDGYIQSGTCAQPGGGYRVNLEGEDSRYDVTPYQALGENGDRVSLGFYGASGVPGFGVAAIYTDQQFSMVVANPDTDDAVACGDILRPTADRFEEAGLAVVQLLPVESSNVQGVAAIERATLQRELDITPTRVRIVLSTEPVSVPSEPRAGYDGYVQSGRCESPAAGLRAALEGQEDHAISPFEALSADAGEPVTVAYYGAAGVPGFGLAAAYTDQDFSLVIADPDSNQPAACGDILQPAADEFVEAGLALVQVQAADGTGVQGFAVVDRLTMQRELDVTPTLMRVLLFAPPATTD